MKNKKRFSKCMLSVATLLMAVPLASQSQNVYAKDVTQGKWPGLINTYGLLPNLKKGKGSGYQGSNGKIGIDLRRTTYKGHSTPGTSNADYVHDHKLDGFLVANVNLKGKNKGDLVNPGRPFGPTKSKFKYSYEGGKKTTTNKDKMSKWIVYMKPKDSEAGKVGMLYKDALLYYPSSKGKKTSKPVKPTHLDVRIIWNGSWRPGDLGAHNNLQFDTNSFGIKEPYQGAANFTLKLYKHNSNKNGTGAAFKTIKTQIKQSDIDHNQGLIFTTPKYLIYDTDADLNSGRYHGWPTKVPGHTVVFGDDNGKRLSNNQGTVYAYQKESQLAYVPAKATNSFNITFVHGYETTPYDYQNKARFASPASSFHSPYTLSKKQQLANHYDKAKDSKGNTRYSAEGATDYFAFEFDKGATIITYEINADKLVSTKKSHFKKTTSKKPLTVKDNQAVYFDIHAQLQGPSSALVKKYNDNDDYNALPIKDALKDKNDPNISHIKDASKNKQRLVLRDYLDSNLKLVDGDKPKIYYAKEWNDKNLSGKQGKADASKYFDVYYAKATKGKHKGQIVIDAVMKDDAAKLSSNAWWKDYHLIIPVKLKDGMSPEHGTKANGWSLISNKAYVNNNGGGKTWVKFKFTHETVKADGKPGVDSKKEVYDANLADPDKLGKKLSWGTNDSNAKLLGDIVNPDQYLYYRLRFTIRPMKAHQKKEIV